MAIARIVRSLVPRLAAWRQLVDSRSPTSQRRTSAPVERSSLSPSTSGEWLGWRAFPFFLFRTALAFALLLSPIALTATANAGMIESSDARTNLIVNGDFSAGAVGFETDYILTAPFTGQGQVNVFTPGDLIQTSPPPGDGGRRS